MRLFILLPRVPFPIEKGDKLRAYHQIRHLSKTHEIILCALNDAKLDGTALPELSKYCRHIHVIRLTRPVILWNIFLAFITGKPLQIGYFYSRRAKKKIDSLIRTYRPDHIFCQLVRVAEYMRNINIPKTLDYQDVFSKGVERRIHSASFYLKPILRLEYKRLLKYEHEVFDHFDNKVIISAPDRDLIPHARKEDITVIPNGVDHSFFQPVEHEKNHDMVFIGNMGYPPNVDAAVFLVEKILPLVRREYPAMTVLLAGATPHARVKALQSETVRVTGWVDDIRECYAGGRIFIAPLQIGTGLQNKLLEAMAMKLPCITTPLANSALGARENEEILVGSTPAELAGHVITLLKDSGKASQLALKGRQFAIDNFSWERNTQKLEEIIMNTKNKQS